LIAGRSGWLCPPSGTGQDVDSIVASIKAFAEAKSSRCNELRDSEPGCPVDAGEEEELALGRLHFGDVDMKEPDGVAFELLPLRLVSLDIRQARYAMTLKAPMQR
jgi:hypothetical protein